jgi:SprT-like family.
MTASLETVQEMFGRFNEMCFARELPPVPIKIVKARTFLGKVTFTCRRGLFGIPGRRENLVMRISSSFDLTQRELEDVVLHEMIHYCIIWKDIHDTSTHGKVFRSMMDRINEEYGRNITVRHHGESGRTELVDLPARENCICIALLDNGKMGITVCAPEKMAAIRRSLPRHFRLQKMTWYRSADPFFSRFPRSRTPKIYKIKEDEVQPHISDAEMI